MSSIRAIPAQHGFTLIECMIALTLGMLIVAAATALLLTAQQTYSAIDDNARIDEAAATALAALGAAIRQAAYADRSGATVPVRPPFNALFGFDNKTSDAKSDPFAPPSPSLPKAVNGSDILVTRFMAADSAGKPDRYMQNCAGGVLKKQPARDGDGRGFYGWSIFYIKRDKAGHEPELFCKYVGDKGGFSADAIVRGVEAMQLLYGIDRNGDGLPETFLQAAAIEGADWTKITAVSIALSIRGAASSTPLSSAASQAKAGIRHLFGAAYSAQHATGDPGVSLDPTRFKPGERNRQRRIVRSIVMLRNGGGLRGGD